MIVRAVMTRECCLQLDYSRQDSLERRASSLESPKSSQEGDHSKGSKDTLDDDTPPEPLERDYPHQHPQPPPRSSLKLQQSRGGPSQSDVIKQLQQQQQKQQQEQQTKDVGIQDRTGVRHSHSSPPNTLFAQASLEVSDRRTSYGRVLESEAAACGRGDGNNLRKRKKFALRLLLKVSSFYNCLRGAAAWDTALLDICCEHSLDRASRASFMLGILVREKSTREPTLSVPEQVCRTHVRRHLCSTMGGFARVLIVLSLQRRSMWSMFVKCTSVLFCF